MNHEPQLPFVQLGTSVAYRFPSLSASFLSTHLSRSLSFHNISAKEILQRRQPQAARKASADLQAKGY